MQAVRGISTMGVRVGRYSVGMGECVCRQRPVLELGARRSTYKYILPEAGPAVSGGPTADCRRRPCVVSVGSRRAAGVLVFGVRFQTLLYAYGSWGDPSSRSVRCVYDGEERVGK